jgi:hypothetical protein
VIVRSPLAPPCRFYDDDRPPHPWPAGGYTVIVHARTIQRGEETMERLVKGGAEPLRAELREVLSRLAEIASAPISRESLA